MTHERKKAATRVNSPRPTRTPPSSSESAAAANQSQGGLMKLKGVVPEVKPLKPGPPKLPSTFCAPWATKITASARRMGTVAKVEEVAISLLNILIASQDELAEREDSNRDRKRMKPRVRGESFLIYEFLVFGLRPLVFGLWPPPRPFDSLNRISKTKVLRPKT